jgi:hypothetical protein
MGEIVLLPDLECVDVVWCGVVWCCVVVSELLLMVFVLCLCCVGVVLLVVI